MSKIVVIGAGQAGSSLCAKLRALGFDGQLTLIGEESDPPYQRPPLSKAYLLGEMTRERLYLRPQSFYDDQGIALHLSHTAVAIDRADQVVIAGGESFAYDQLALTTGAVPRRLPGAIGGELAGVHVVRGLGDVDALATELPAGGHVLIVGGGYIGLEAAAVARKLGLNVTLLEAAERILGRVACAETANYFRALHTEQGVSVREGAALDRLVGQDRVIGARLSDGTELRVDAVIVGIGISPATELAETAGLSVDQGIVVDEFGRTSDPAIWAAGDCAVFPFRGQMTRLESVQNAIDGAETVAANMLGAATAYDPKPWFWSDQYDVKLQIAGLNRGYDQVITRGQGSEMSVWYYAGGTLLAVDAMNAPRDYMVGKRLIDAGRTADPAKVADTTVPIKDLMA